MNFIPIDVSAETWVCCVILSSLFFCSVWENRKWSSRKLFIARKTPQTFCLKTSHKSIRNAEKNVSIARKKTQKRKAEDKFFNYFSCVWRKYKILLLKTPTNIAFAFLILMFLRIKNYNSYRRKIFWKNEKSSRCCCCPWSWFMRLNNIYSLLFAQSMILAIYFIKIKISLCREKSLVFLSYQIP